MHEHIYKSRCVHALSMDERAATQASTITKEGQAMSMMCSMQGCEKRAGMCGHEKMMLVMMVMAMVGGAAYWFLG